MNGQRVAIPGSEIQHAKDARWSPAPVEERIRVTIYLRRGADLCPGGSLAEDLLSGRFQQIPREEAAEKLGASPEDLEAVRAFAKNYSLSVVDENPAARTVHIEGQVAKLASAFQVEMGILETASGRYLSYKGPLTVPESLKDVITAALGLDRRPVARRA
ncbi:MAG TPA: protease pro-enzyme activation domain-containing protein [Bryobacteraceae bacterium]|nr:protease pro-enzyme activation domain-containing protein [Bryobacteraceae bacterium]